jgi:putative membrane protein
VKRRPIKARHILTHSGGITMRWSSLALVAGVSVMFSTVVSGNARAQEAALDDATIVAIFDAANTAEIETGSLAAQRGSTQEVRDFGAMLARDHKAVRQQGRDLAAKLGVTPTPPKDDQAAKDHAAAMARLRSLEGAAFDSAFLKHEAEFHQAVIGAVNTTLLPAIQSEELKALVVKVAPAFEAHMKMARELEKKAAQRA